MHRAALALLILGACAAPSSSPPARANAARFPESPRLEALVPRGAWIFEQETWSAPSEQHCWEWGFPEREQTAVVDALRTAMRGIWPDAELASGSLRRDGAAIAYAPGFRVDSLDPASAVLKIIVCTEHLASAADRDAFLRSLESAPLWAEVPSIGVRHASGWRRRFATGRSAIGARFDALVVDDVARSLSAAGYVERARESLVLELRRGRSRARFQGETLWWQTDDAR